MKYEGPPQSGSLSNLTFSRNTYGQYQRARVGRGGSPSYSIAGAVAAWQALNHDQQIRWQKWASTIVERDSIGRSRSLTGAQQFVSAWMLLTTAGGSAPTDAPFERVNTGLTDVFLVATTTQNVTLNATVVGSGGWWEVQYVVPWSSLGTNFPPGRNAWWNSQFPGFVTAGPVAWSRLYPLPPSQKRVMTRTRLVAADGIATPWIYSGPVVIG